jgi:hypothetical protein
VYDYLEYLIQWLDEEPEVGEDCYETVIRPNSVPSSVDYSGNWGLVLAEGIFSFSWEPPGLQVIFSPKDQTRGPSAEQVTGWVQEMCDNITRVYGVRAKVLVEDGEVWAF